MNDVCQRAKINDYFVFELQGVFEFQVLRFRVSGMKPRVRACSDSRSFLVI